MLREAQFAAFGPYGEFIESFGSQEEIEEHRRYAIETAKQRLGRPWPMKLTAVESESLYASRFLEELRAKRDAQNCVPEGEIDTRFPGVESLWRREIDPCRRNMVRLKLENREEYRSRWNAAQTRMREMLTAEASVHSKRSYTVDRFEMEDRFDTYRYVMARDAANQGLSYDPQKSSPEYPVYSKRVTDQWHLCWTLNHLDMFALSPREGIIDLSLDLRSATLPGSTENAVAGQFLLFRFQSILPGFNDAYRRFDRLEQEETILKAHLTFYKIISASLESAIVEGLSG